MWWHRLRPPGQVQLIAEPQKMFLGGRPPRPEDCLSANLEQVDPLCFGRDRGALDLDGPVKRLITPDDPDAFETAVRGHVDPGMLATGSRRSSIV
jgi:hypothetical protein